MHIKFKKMMSHKEKFKNNIHTVLRLTFNKEVSSTDYAFSATEMRTRVCEKHRMRNKKNYF